MIDQTCPNCGSKRLRKEIKYYRCADCDTLIEFVERTCNSECGMRMKYGVSCKKHDCEYIIKV